MNRETTSYTQMEAVYVFLMLTVWFHWSAPHCVCILISRHGIFFFPFCLYSIITAVIQTGNACMRCNKGPQAEFNLEHCSHIATCLHQKATGHYRNSLLKHQPIICIFNFNGWFPKDDQNLLPLRLAAFKPSSYTETLHWNRVLEAADIWFLIRSQYRSDVSV